MSKQKEPKKTAESEKAAGWSDSKNAGRDAGGSRSGADQNKNAGNYGEKNRK